jgi:hypothetical protein
VTWWTIAFVDEGVDAVMPPDDIVMGWLALARAIVDKGDRCLNCGVRRSIERGRCRSCYCYHRIHGTDRPSRLSKADVVRVRTVPAESELQA